MGIFINIGNMGFQSARNGEYVDKSGLIRIVNKTINSERRFSCVTRCRRFGKSMAAKMLCAYYDQSCDSRHLFTDLEIANDPDFERYLNKYPVIYLDMTAFVTRFHNESIVEHIEAELRIDILETFPEVKVKETDDLMGCLIRIAAATGQQFIMIIDEWDAICREFTSGTSAMDTYVNWLRRMFKEVNAVNVFAAVYMTGILPIKKYKTESALNNFQEYSMVEPRRMSPFFGFTKDEVRTLAEQHNMPFAELEKWYDGYQIGDEPSMFNPNSVMQAIDAGRCRSFWASTGAFDTVANYINMNYEGLKDDIIQIIAYYYAKNDYIMHRELATGKSFADIVFIPRKNVDLPALVIELKVNKDADSAIDQIRRKEYPIKVQEYADRLLLVGINYDRETKQHTCRIEKG